MIGVIRIDVMLKKGKSQKERGLRLLNQFDHLPYLNQKHDKKWAYICSLSEKLY